MSRRPQQLRRPDAASLVQQTDVELVAQAQAGCTDSLDTLIDRYRRFARNKARGYFLVGADADDVEQEALIGIYKAARDYRDDQDCSFRAFADLCVTRQIITAIKSATRQKHQALNQYVSISGERTPDGAAARPVDDLIHLHRHAEDPAEGVVADERFVAVRRRLAEVLSGLEVEVLARYVEGRSYQEIAEELGRHAKSIDNALQRIKKKLELTLDERAAADLVDELALSA